MIKTKGLQSMTKVYVAKGRHTDLLKLPEYFAEQAKRGKFVTQITSLWFIFEVREPAEIEYNLIPINNHDEFEQIQQLEGWQYITMGSDFALIYAPVGTPLSLVCDQDTLLVKLNYMRVMYVLRFLLAVGGLAFSLLAIYQYWFSARWLSICAIVLSALLLLFASFELVPLLQLQRSMKNLQNKRDA